MTESAEPDEGRIDAALAEIQRTEREESKADIERAASVDQKIVDALTDEAER